MTGVQGRGDGTPGTERVCPYCEHEWRRHDPDDGRCDAHSAELGAFGPCRCGRDVEFTAAANARLSREALDANCGMGRAVTKRAVTAAPGCDDWFHDDDGSLCCHVAAESGTEPVDRQGGEARNHEEIEAAMQNVREEGNLIGVSGAGHIRALIEWAETVTATLAAVRSSGSAAQDCPECVGDGLLWKPEGNVTCPTCGGSGSAVQNHEEKP